MFIRIIKATIIVALTTALPLIGSPELLGSIQILTLAAAGLIMLLTQPELKREETKQTQSTDRWSVIAILFAGMTSQIAAVVEWSSGGGSSELFPTTTSIIGFAMIVGGLMFRIWSIRTLGRFFTATVQIVEGHRVIKQGPYAIVRHPSYLGAYVTFIGIGILLGSPMSTVYAILSMGLAYVWRVSVEEQTLLATFGQEYSEYRNKVKAIIPGIL
jgi:protein-S-isoprenylcysteine O-methyltransferase Ste14